MINRNNFHRFSFVLVILATRLIAGTYSGGNGTPTDPYRIRTITDLLALGQNESDYDKHFVLMADIDLGGQVFLSAIIAPDEFYHSEFSGIPFVGTFNGNNHKIMNLIMNGDIDEFVGLFGQIGPGGLVSNLTIENFSFSGSTYCSFVSGLCGENVGTIRQCNVSGMISFGDYSSKIGGLCARNKGAIDQCMASGTVSVGDYSSEIAVLCGVNYGTISHCHAEGSVTGGMTFFTRRLGGLCGYNGGTISRCYATCTINAYSNIGGLCGENSGTQSQIIECYATGSVIGNIGVGGLCGDNTGTITQCFATGRASGTESYVGGLCGENGFGGMISDCYATGQVTGKVGIGGLCGSNYSGTIEMSYATATINGSSNLGGLCGDNSGTINKCYAIGSVLGDDSDIGGLIGGNDGIILQCYATGSVKGYSSVGGVCGDNDNGTLTQCYSTGSTWGSYNIGGLCGDNDGGKVIQCYSTGKVTVMTYFGGGLCGAAMSGEVTGSFWDIETSGKTTSKGGFGKTTGQMHDINTFYASQWDFSESDGDPADWMMLRPGEDYPRLAWQKIFPGDIAGLYGVDLNDFNELASHWLQSNCPVDCNNADINQDGIVDIQDFIILYENWLGI